MWVQLLCRVIDLAITHFFFFFITQLCSIQSHFENPIKPTPAGGFLQGFYILIRLIYRLNIVFIYLLIYLFAAMSIALLVKPHVMAVVNNGKMKEKYNIFKLTDMWGAFPIFLYIP